LIETSFSCLLTNYNRTKLAVITNQNDVFSSFENWDEGFWFSCLSCFINQYLLELKVTKTPIKSSDTGCANNVSIFEDFFFCLLF